MVVIMIIKYILLFTFIIFSQNINSEETKSEDKKEIVIEETITFDESMDDLTNRFILATFGKDALNWFESSKISDIKDVDNYDNKIAPFKNLNILISPLFVFLLNLTISMFVIYLSWISYQGLFKTQNSGDFLGKSWNKTFFIVKISVVIALISPIPTIEDKSNKGKDISEQLNKISLIENKSNDLFGKYSLIQGITFKIAGLSNELGKGINLIITENQPSSYPAYRIPQSDVKIKIMKNLVDFYICLKNKGSIQDDIYLNFNKNKSNYESFLSIDNCSLNVSFSIDNITSNYAKNHEDVYEIVGDYEKTQESIYIKSITEIFKYADIVSDNILTRTPNDREIENKLIENEFKKYTKISNDYNEDLIEYWEFTCKDVLSDSLFTNRDVLTNEEREIYSYMSYRCLSDYLQKTTVFDQAKSIESSKSYLKKNNYLRNNMIELCTHDYKTEDNKINKFSYQESSDELKEKILKGNNEISDKYLSVKECIIKECSTLNSENSNLYMCANSINLYNKVENDKLNDKYGFFAIGASIYNKFKGFSSENTKTFFNSFNIISNSSWKTTPETDLKIKITNQKLERSSFSKDMIEKISLYNIQSLNNKYFDLQNQNSNSRSLGSTTNYIFDNDFMGVNRLKNCIANPLIISEGYSCGSVTEEYHNFGSNLFTVAVNLKIMVTIIDSLKGIVKESGRFKGKDTSGIKDKGIKNVKDSKPFKIIAMIIPAIASSSIYTTLEKIQNNAMHTDEFGNMDSKKASYFSENDYIMATLAGLTAFGGETVFNFIDNFLNILLFISIFFKYVIPLIPYYFYLILVFGWVLLIFEMLFIMPIWAIYIMKPSQNHTSEILKKGLNMFISLLLKIPLLILGTILAWIMTNTVATRLINLYDFDSVMDISYGQSLTGIFDVTVSVFVYLIILFVLSNMTLSTMNNFYDFCTNWMSGKIDNVRIGKDNTSQVASQTKSIAASAGIKGFM
jgi:hypothetical protein